MKRSVSSTFFRFLRLPNALHDTFFGKIRFWHKFVKLVHAQTLDIPHYMVRVHIYQCVACVDSLIPCKVHRFGKKMLFFHEIFQVGACPNLKDSSLYERFSGHMNKA